MAVWAIVLAGGAGTRFWPASRTALPKQLLPLVRDDESLLVGTIRRIAPVVPAAQVIVATGEHLRSQTREALAAVPGVEIMAEPVPRNTAPAIAWVTDAIFARDPEALCIVLPSDHFIASPDTFTACVKLALEAARGGYLATIGIKPTRAETGFGYIELGGNVAEGFFEAKRFVEKPNAERAAEYLASGRFLWNAGMFFYAARDMMEAVRQHLPDVARGLDEIRAEPTKLAAVFGAFPSVSIDHGVMEKASRVAVVPGDFGWSDLGSWQSAWELSSKDADGNVLPERGVAVDAHGNLVWARGSKKTYALLGVSDLVVVETDDAVLVVPRARAQEVRAIVERLGAKLK